MFLHVALMQVHMELIVEDLRPQVCWVVLEMVQEMLCLENQVFLALAFHRLLQ